MRAASNGFDPNQKRDTAGKWQAQHGTRPAGGLVGPPRGPSEEQWPEDAWPAEEIGHEVPDLYEPDSAPPALELTEPEPPVLSPSDHCARCERPIHANGLCLTHDAENNYGSTGLHEGSRTPWGPAQIVNEIAPGIASVHTAGHGGYKLSPKRNAQVPAALRTNGWYEEDVEWAAVGVTFPGEIAAEHPGGTVEGIRQWSEQALRNHDPDAYEAWKGVTLAPGTSYVKDQRAWAETGRPSADDGGDPVR